MAEKRKFAALADIHRLQAEPGNPEQIAPRVQTTPMPIPEGGRGRGRPATGKRSNPQWKLYSHFLKKQTQRAATAKLQAEDDDRDLSDVLQQLLETWLEEE